MSLLTVKNLHTYFDTEEGVVKAVEGIDMTIEEGEIVGLVGESGSGKSVTAKSILRLIDSPGKIVDGSITFDGRELLAMSEAELRRIRGNEMSMIFQDSMTAFNPTQTVGRQIHDVLRTHESGSVGILKRAIKMDHSKEHQEQVIEVLDRVGIPSPESRYSDYPHEFSGGMLQRAMIAMSIICNPSLIIADEPTTALDVSIESQILSIVRDLVEQLNTSLLWITHDLSVISEICDKVVVMYAGKVLETGPMEDVLERPQHPYTRELLKSVPRYDRPDQKLHLIEGSIPNPTNLPTGCRFADRCPDVHEQCWVEHPPMYNVGEQSAACYLHEMESEVEMEGHE